MPGAPRPALRQEPGSDPGWWDYGGCEGLTTEQIQETRPGWDLWRDGVVPGDAAHPGEQLEQVAARTDAVLDRIRPLLRDGDVDRCRRGAADLLTPPGPDQ
ncbi:histidine phosphatase family protein [Streptomyces sp. NPDC054961]